MQVRHILRRLTTGLRRHAALGWLVLGFASVPAQAAGVGGMFGEGHAQFSLVAGNAYAFDNSYFVVGGSASYFVADGLGVGLSLENWSGNGPAIRKYAPFVQYVFLPDATVHPYVGGFYRHTTVSGLPSINSLGARAGILLASGTNSVMSLGVVHESYLNCQETLYKVCRETHPELAITFGF